VAGTTEGLVRVFDTKTRSVLRDFHGHRGATRVTRFSRDNLTVMSGSDDMTLRAWDLMTAQQLSSMTGHKDYIRAGCIHPSTPDIWASGSYDHTVKLWDMRSNTETTTLNHGAPVEDLLIFPSGGILVSAGGENVKIWDLFKNTLLTTLDGHQKTVTSLYVDNNRSTLFSASLDHGLRVYGLQNYQLLHTVKYPAPIMAIGYSPGATHLVVGMADGMLSIRHRDRPTKVDAPPKEAHFTDDIQQKKPERPQREHDIIVPKPQKKKIQLKSHERSLRKFEFKAALFVALQGDKPRVTLSVISELLDRQELDITLGQLDEPDLVTILEWVAQYITHASYAETVMILYEMLLDSYSSVCGQSARAIELVEQITQKLQAEVLLQKEMEETAGILDLIFSQK